jgi:hypothetical protein
VSTGQISNLYRVSLLCGDSVEEFEKGICGLVCNRV